MKDLIEERNKRDKMQRSILKWWNVHYMTPEELEEEQENENDPSVTGTAHQSDSAKTQELSEQGADAREVNMQPEEGNDVADSEDTFNATTGSNSGVYGKGGADPEYEDQIAAILMEKDDALRDLIEHAEEEGEKK